MVAIHIKIDIFHQRFECVVVGGLQLLPDRAFLHLDVVVKIGAIGQHVAQNVNGVGHAVFEGLHVVNSKLTRRKRIQLRSTVLNLCLKLIAVSTRTALKMKMLEEMSLA